MKYHGRSENLIPDETEPYPKEWEELEEIWICEMCRLMKTPCWVEIEEQISEIPCEYKKFKKIKFE